MLDQSFSDFFYLRGPQQQFEIFLHHKRALKTKFFQALTPFELFFKIWVYFEAYKNLYVFPKEVGKNEKKLEKKNVLVSEKKSAP